MLKHIEQYKELSFGEKTILHQTEALLVEEIVLVCEVAREKAIQQLRSAGNFPVDHPRAPVQMV